MPEKKSDLKSLLKSASLPERVVAVVLDRQLVTEFQRAEDELEKAHEARARDRRLGTGVQDAAKKVEAIREKMRESTVEFTLRGMRAADWRALKAEHPVGDDPTPEDNLLGADVNALFDAAVRKSIVSPEIDDDDWSKLVDVLTEGEWDRFTNAVYALNEQGTNIPFSQAASVALRSNDDD